MSINNSGHSVLEKYRIVEKDHFVGMNNLESVKNRDIGYNYIIINKVNRKKLY